MIQELKIFENVKGMPAVHIYSLLKERLSNKYNYEQESPQHLTILNVYLKPVVHLYAQFDEIIVSEVKHSKLEKKEQLRIYRYLEDILK